ncbi:MAG TPA: dihydrodipicolinate synthase family protein [Sphingobacteriaceae bacterium]|nr:dihydrodipicolinate synthase family protein [Sphingobacteriaceae bacterium]
MKTLYPLFGIVTVLNTPFTNTDQIDTISLRKNVKNALNAGVGGFLVPAMASEVYKLSFEERLEIISCVLDEVNGRVPVIAGGGGTELSASKKTIDSCIKLGCKNILFQIPYHNESQFYDHFMELADLGPEMIMLQDWDASGYGLPDDLICKLFEEVEAFRCLKVETVPAGVKYSRILKHTNNQLNISGGWAVTQMIEGLERGVHAFMPTGMHYIYTKIYRDYMNGKHNEAKKLFHELSPVLAFSNQHLDISIHFFKRLLYQQGAYTTSLTRHPILEFDAIHKGIADELISRIISMEEKIKKEIIV